MGVEEDGLGLGGHERVLEALLAQRIVGSHDRHRLRGRTVGGGQPVGAGGRKDVHAVLLDQAQLPQAGADLADQLEVVVEAHVLIGAQLKVRPLLVDLLLLAIDDLLDLLRLLMGLEELSRAESLCIAKFLGAGQDDVEDGRNVIGRAVDELVDGVGVASGDGLAIDLGAAGHLETEGRLVGDLGLQNSVFQRHVGSCGEAPTEALGGRDAGMVWGSELSGTAGWSGEGDVLWAGEESVGESSV